jgi:hypothetical protein
MHGIRAAIPQTSPLAEGEFATMRERLIKVGTAKPFARYSAVGARAKREIG